MTSQVLKLTSHRIPPKGDFQFFAYPNIEVLLLRAAYEVKLKLFLVSAVFVFCPDTHYYWCDGVSRVTCHCQQRQPGGCDFFYSDHIDEVVLLNLFLYGVIIYVYRMCKCIPQDDW